MLLSVDHSVKVQDRICDLMSFLSSFMPGCCRQSYLKGFGKFLVCAGGATMRPAPRLLEFADGLAFKTAHALLDVSLMEVHVASQHPMHHDEP